MEINSAIEAVYEAFADVEKPDRVEGCPCCMTAEQYEILTAKPLRELTADELTHYASGVMLTMGSEIEYPYFLPRILELTVEDDTRWICDIETTAKKLNMSGMHQWDSAKNTAIKNLWLAEIEGLASSEVFYFDINSWLAAAIRIPIDVRPFLDTLEKHPPAVKELYDINAETLPQGRLNNPFLDNASKEQTEVVEWLKQHSPS